LHNVSVKIGGITLLDGVNAEMHCGEVTALIGPNGAGKTTLLKAIAGLLPYTGAINFCTESSCGSGRPKIGYVPQYLDFDHGIPITVLDFLSMKEQRLPLWFWHRRDSIEAAREGLEWVGASHLVNRPLGKLSGGEMQRVMLAFALLGKPDVMLMDEPVSGVDASGEEIFIELLHKLQAEKNFTVVLVSHDLSVVSKHADHVICLNRTVKGQGKTPEVLTPENISSLYGTNATIHHHGEEPLTHHHD
jgi:zinc transport system ATP-binding protein